MSPFKHPSHVYTLAAMAVALGVWSMGATGRLTSAEWHSIDGGRSAPLNPPVGTGTTGFTRLPGSTTGIGFTNRIARARFLVDQIPLNGSGVCAGDVDGDGRVDVFFGGLSGTSVLYRNLGDWRFENRTAQAFPGAVGARFSGVDVTGCAFADVDGDGDLDLVLNTLGKGTWLLVNDGRGVFELRETLNPNRCGASMALSDFDGDGDLDLYIANYRVSTVRDDPSATFRITQEDGYQRVAFYNGRSTSEPDLVGRFYVTPGGVKENGEPDLLCLNDGRGHFEPVSWSSGVFVDEEGNTLVAPPYDWGLSVMARDFTGDGLPDLYVCNDFESPDRFWVNATAPGGPLRFRAASLLAVRSTSAFSMGVDGADVNRDGVWDFFTADMRSRRHDWRSVQIQNLPPNASRVGVYLDRSQYSHNTLQLGRGDGTFSEVGRLAGLSASEWSWTPAFLDVDLDGFEDLIISNGHELDMMDADAATRAEMMKAQKKLNRQELLELRGLFRRGNSPNAAFRNATGAEGNATRAPRFVDVSAEWGLADAEVSNGLCLADLDGDGDLDVMMNNLNGEAGVYRNNSNAARVAVRLKGARGNTRGIGAVARLECGESSPAAGGWAAQSQEFVAGGRYLSGDDTCRMFAASPAGATAGAVRRLTVTWRSGRVTVVSPIEPGRVYEVTEEKTQPLESKPGTEIGPLFRDLTSGLNHTHVEAPFNDRERQPLQPRFLSNLGPGVAWADLDGDGKDELMVSTGRSGRLGVFANESTPGAVVMKAMTNAVLAKPAGRDQTTVLFNAGVILAGSSNFEDGTTNGGVVRLVSLPAGKSGESALGQDFSAGPVALGDVDGDGTLEQFVGGRVRAGRYPEPATSVLFRVREGRSVAMQRFEGLGLVNAARFTDYDGDGDLDLVLATEWGPVRVFRNRGGAFTEQTAALGLDRWRGWWNSIAVGDFDEDGRLDWLAGNWGWNEFLSHGAPMGDLPQLGELRTAHFADFEGRGAPDILEGWFEPGSRIERPVRQFPSLSTAMPVLREKYPTLADFGRATMPELIAAVAAPGSPKASTLTANWFATTLFLNRGDHFEARALPFEAQVSPVFGLVVADLDGDGHEDVFAAQNFHQTHPEDARQDAGRGVLLLGDGRGGFRAVRGQESGLQLYGEGRGAAVCDVDGDGRLDLVVAQNAAETRLFQNTYAKPGLRVRLRGSTSNPSVIGAWARLIQEDWKGPWHEVSAGSGYWSSDSAVMVLGRKAGPATLEVRWPAGAVKSYPIAADALETTAQP